MTKRRSREIFRKIQAFNEDRKHPTPRQLGMTEHEFVSHCDQTWWDCYQLEAEGHVLDNYAIRGLFPKALELLKPSPKTDWQRVGVWIALAVFILTCLCILLRIDKK
jgi:hypothetical protein